ncbi:hypothetical protein BDV29DRAFT_157260 [Aspergillus leporis]|uniref:RNase H type-1 domain-containing protein n=1 Tax=Aspergillus leporis TaxID=41062 RepID=A0A5N5X156_9EURO|nr:hypothetical protein BDV29DRAFT_157260 [Aspergillus leporis]
MLPHPFVDTTFFPGHNPMDNANEATFLIANLALHQPQPHYPYPSSNTTTITSNNKTRKRRQPPSTSLDQPTTPPKPTKRQKKKAQNQALERKIVRQPNFYLDLESTFYGTLIAQKQHDAVAHALSVHNSTLANTSKGTGGPQEHIFWVDASGSSNASGAAIVYRNPTCGDEWLDRGYTIADLGGPQLMNVSELFAIGAALKVALARVGKRVQGVGQQGDVVRVFSDSLGALRLLWKADSSQIPCEMPAWKVAGYVCEISRQLFEMGVKVEVNWVPGKSRIPIPGHKRGDVLSRAAARHAAFFERRGMGISADGVIQVVRSDFLEVLP